MASTKQNFIELHDATGRLVTVGAGGLCELSLEGVSRFRHIRDSRFTREVFNATLVLSGCEAIEVSGSWAASDN